MPPDPSKLLAGFERFRARYFVDEPELFAELGQQQTPVAMVIACCDSRVDPAMLTGAGPGELFVVRNVANLVPPYVHEAEAPGVRSAIEFAVKSLKVPHIIVLGHSSCGGIRALMEGEGTTQHRYEFIGPWVVAAVAARDQALREFPDGPPEAQARACEHHSIRHSLDNLRTFPWIAERIATGALALHGWYFDISNGALQVYDAEADRFAEGSMQGN